ncbi:hypothetical protein NLX83_17825 [Allokutzneria sp. A3M-2-11 16]|uniref:hypothetical protein n=1 Tax=Allokutzneria sp. A3M-2-11 16 TaxID=2962043 RepID=UPI0020B8F584|nr:hypothetical protein [Allokutzneria sp. A3M-2-11 16]MCP3801123.1 hypothetical protein [Allokutzneria sp. A3M-2-11 16]
MRLVRLGGEPTKVGADVRAALAAWGDGTSVLGGIALLGVTPPGCTRPLDALIVLPRVVLVVVGVDLPSPALRLEAPLQGQWKVDGWPLTRHDGANSPAEEALAATRAVTARLQEVRAEPLPVCTVIAVGPYVERVIQPTSDIHRGVRVLHPKPSSLLSAVRELAISDRPCTAEQACRLLAGLHEEAGELHSGELISEGFPDAVTADLASARTALIPRYRDVAAPEQPVPPKRKGPRFVLAGLALLAVVLLIVIVSSGGGGEQPVAQNPAPTSTRSTVDDLDFTPRGNEKATNCARESYGDVQTWFDAHPCAGLIRTLFEVSEPRRAAVSIAVVSFSDPADAEEFQKLADTPGTGAVSDLVASGKGWTNGPTSFEGAAFASSRDTKRVRVVQVVWIGAPSTPDDVSLRGIAARALRLPLPG